VATADNRDRLAHSRRPDPLHGVRVLRRVLSGAVRLDDWGYAWLKEREIDAAGERLARETARRCPTARITVEEIIDATTTWPTGRDARGDRPMSRQASKMGRRPAARPGSCPSGMLDRPHRRQLDRRVRSRCGARWWPAGWPARSRFRRSPARDPHAGERSGTRGHVDGDQLERQRRRVLRESGEHPARVGDGHALADRDGHRAGSAPDYQHPHAGAGEHANTEPTVTPTPEPLINPSAPDADPLADQRVTQRTTSLGPTIDTQPTLDARTSPISGRSAPMSSSCDRARRAGGDRGARSAACSTRSIAPQPLPPGQRAGPARHPAQHAPAGIAALPRAAGPGAASGPRQRWLVRSSTVRDRRRGGRV